MALMFLFVFHEGLIFNTFIKYAAIFFFCNVTMDYLLPFRSLFKKAHTPQKLKFSIKDFFQ